MRRAALALAAALGALAAAAAPAHATSECNGFLACVPVAGPWVVVPTGARAPIPLARFRLACPKRFVVGGLDAELSSRGIDVSFGGALGSPVNPGITTTTAATFEAASTQPGTRAPTFRPHIGCIPATGGGARVPTSVRRIFPPGRPVTWRVRTRRVGPGRSRVAVACSRGERLVGASHAIGFYTPRPPGVALVRAVSASRATRGARVVVSVRATAAVAGIRAVVQAAAICAGGQ